MTAIVLYQSTGPLTPIEIVTSRHKMNHQKCTRKNAKQDHSSSINQRHKVKTNHQIKTYRTNKHTSDSNQKQKYQMRIHWARMTFSLVHKTLALIEDSQFHPEKTRSQVGHHRILRPTY